MIVDILRAQGRGHEGDCEDRCQCAMNRVHRYLYAVEMNYDRV